MQTWQNSLEELTLFDPDLCVMDLHIHPEGYEICRVIRNHFPLLPLIFLVEDHGHENIVRGFQAGGTGFLRKPYQQQELLSCIQVHLRPRPGDFLLNASFREEIRLGKCIFSPDICRLVTPEKVFSLSLREMQVLLVLSDFRNCLVDRKNLLMEIWGDDSENNSRNLDVYIRRIRKLLQSDLTIGIHTVKTKGYLFLDRIM